VGRRIRVPEVRVIGADGGQVGIMQTHEALRLAEEQGLELVEVNPRAAPPVCRIMDFGKFKYETSKKEKESRKHQSTVMVKEVKFRPKTDDHDLDFKVKHIRRFLAEGNKCRLAIAFRGREIVHPETGQMMIDQVLKQISDIAVVEQRATMEGRRMVLVVGPKAGVIRRDIGSPAAAPVAGSARGGGGAAGPANAVGAKPAEPAAGDASAPAGRSAEAAPQRPQAGTSAGSSPGAPAGRPPTVSAGGQAGGGSRPTGPGTGTVADKS
jgi:translation initiation factor IF-3